MLSPSKNSGDIKRAIYPGTFDPPTNGHIDIARRASLIFDEVIVGVAENPAKKTLFTIEERIEMLNVIFSGCENILVKPFSSLLVDFAREEKAIAIVRGLRAVSDFDYEIQMASMNFMLYPNIVTLFFMASDENLFVSSSIIKEIARLGGDVSKKVHPFVLSKLREKLKLK